MISQANDNKHPLFKDGLAYAKWCVPLGILSGFTHPYAGPEDGYWPFIWGNVAWGLVQFAVIWLFFTMAQNIGNKGRKTWVKWIFIIGIWTATKFAFAGLSFAITA